MTNNNNDDTTTTSLSSSSYSYYQHQHQHQQNNSDHDQSSVKMMMNRRNKKNNMSLSSPSSEKIDSNRIMLEEDNNSNTNCNNNINNNKIGRFTRNNKHSNNNNKVNNNHNGNGNSNSWQWLSMFLLLYSLSLQFGVFDRTKTSINGYGGNNNDSTSPSRSSGNTRGQQQHHHHDHRGLEIDDERVPSSPSFSSSDSTNAMLFESLEASHEHHLARRMAPPEHHNREGRSNRNSNRNSDSNHRQMGTAPSSSSSSSSSSEQQQQQQGQTSRRHQEGIEDYEKWKDDITKMANTNTNNNENGSTTQENTQQYTTQSQSILSTSMEGRLRATLLTNYDRNSYPWEWAWEQHYNEAIYDRVGDKKDVMNNNGTTTAEEYSNMDIHNNDTNETDTEGMSQPQKRTGLPVEFGLNFHKVHALNVAESTADLVVWVRMKWTDPRLRWDPTEFGGLTTTWFFLTDGIGGGEVSEIWTPDVYLWNQEEAMPNCLANTYATVSSDGSIFWSRPGRIKASCKYEGLESFPFDKLGCKIEFGSWSHSGLYFRPIKLDGTGYTVGGSETARGSYVEFNLMEEEVEVEEVVYPPYPCCPEEDWPVLIYSLKFGRASNPYVRSVILINILLNVAAFACFWIPPHVGERMGLAITCVLAAVAGELVITAMLPVCDELSWYNKFSIGSTTFALLVVFESAIVIFFFYYTAEDLTPTYVKWLQKKRKKIQDARIQQIQERKSEVCKKEENTMTCPVESSDEGQKQQEGNELKSLSTSYNGVSCKVGMDFQISANDDTNNQLNGITKDDKNQQDRILHDRTGFVRFDESNIGPKSHSNNRRDMFSDTKTYWRSEKSMVQMVDAGNFKNEAEADMNAYWQGVSGYIDEGARLLIPLLYCVFLGYIFQSRS